MGLKMTFKIQNASSKSVLIRIIIYYNFIGFTHYKYSYHNNYKDGLEL